MLADEYSFVHYMVRHMIVTFIKGQLGVPLTVCPWYLLCSTLGFLGMK